jgi:hypothetical protein
MIDVSVHYKLTEDEYRFIGRHAGVSEVVVRRLCRSQYVVISLPPSSLIENPDSKRVQLGLRVEDGDSEFEGTPTSPHTIDEFCKQIARCIRDYMKSCPLVFQWIGRGDYNPKKVPETLSPPTLIHAARTAGRLRSQLARALHDYPKAKDSLLSDNSIKPTDKT